MKKAAIKLLLTSWAFLGGIVGGLTESYAQSYPFGNPNPRVQTLKAGDETDDNGFGVSVSVAGTLMAVGAHQAISDSNATQGGAVYLFELGTDGHWTEIQKLTAVNPTSGAQFGWSVSLQADGLAIGAPLDNGGKGSVYFFAPNASGIWSQRENFQYCTVVGDACGYAVALQSDWQSRKYSILAGAPGVGSDRGDFRLIEKSTASNLSPWTYALFNYTTAAGDRLGETLDWEGDHFIIGAPGANNRSGKAFLYHYANSNWSQTQNYTGSPFSGFAEALGVDGNFVVIGAPAAGTAPLGEVYAYLSNLGQGLTSNNNNSNERHFGRGIDIKGTRLAISGTYSVTSLPARYGMVSVFDWDGNNNTWNEVQQFVDYPPIGMGYRNSIALSEGRIAIGAMGKWPEKGVVRTYHQPTIGGSVSNLNGELVLQNNQGDNLTLTADGNFAFYTPLSTGDSYHVTILSEPQGQDCTVDAGSGTVGTLSINTIEVDCLIFVDGFETQ